MIIITASTIKNTTSTIKINGIFEVGFTRSIISQLVSSGAMFAITKSADFGMIGDHCLSTRLPFEYTPMLNYSMKLFERPIPIVWYGTYREWNPVWAVWYPATIYLLSLRLVSTQRTLAPLTVVDRRSSLIMRDLR